MRIETAMNHNQNDGLLKMIRRTDPVIPGILSLLVYFLIGRFLLLTLILDDFQLWHTRYRNCFSHSTKKGVPFGSTPSVIKVIELFQFSIILLLLFKICAGVQVLDIPVTINLSIFKNVSLFVVNIRSHLQLNIIVLVCRKT